MKIIANIVTKNKNDLFLNKTIPDYIQILDYNDDVNYSLPTLYIGYLDIRENNLFTITDIFNNKINTFCYWCYSKTERLSSFHDNIDWFVENSPKIYFSNTFIYKPFHYLFDENTQQFNINKIIKVYSNKRSIFVLMSDNKTIFGFDKNYHYFINDLTIINEIQNLDVEIYHDNDFKLLNLYQANIPSMYETIEKYLVGV